MELFETDRLKYAHGIVRRVAAIIIFFGGRIPLSIVILQYQKCLLINSVFYNKKNGNWYYPHLGSYQRPSYEFMTRVVPKI